VAVAQGHVWEVWLSDDAPAQTAAGGAGPETHDQTETQPYGAAANGSLNGVVHQTPDGVHAPSDARRAASDAGQRAWRARRWAGHQPARP
jgi:hypothetical protein